MRQSKLLLVIATVALLQGCVAAAVVTVVGSATAVNDRRSIGHQIDDQTIELNAYAELKNMSELDGHSNIQVVSVNGTVLVVGQVESAYLKDAAIKTISAVNGVLQLHNQLKIGTPTSILTRSNDVWLTTKVKTALFGGKNIDATNIKVVTENAEVFLMGILSETEVQEAVEITRNVSGVNRVYNAFEIKQSK